jgi:hypothetical protein
MDRTDDRSPTWAGSCRSGWAWPLVAVGAIGAVAAAGVALSIGSGAAAAWWLVAVVAAVLVVAGVPFTTIEATVDRRGLRVRYGPLGWPVTTVRLDRIIAVRVEPDLAPSRWGGWGYRGSLRLVGRAAIVLRRGPAIVVELERGRTLAVTVDDAAAGAAVLDQLRAAPTAGSG